MIRPVDEIPQNVSQQRESYRQHIRDDIQEALDKGIGKFEFIGNYNYKYLAQYARKEADRIWWKIFRDITLPHYPEWKEKYKQKYIFLNEWEMRKFCNIRIHSVKSDTPGEKRVFCEICDYEEMKKNVLNACEEKLAEHQRIDEERKEEEKRGKLKMKANDETESFDFSEELP